MSLDVQNVEIVRKGTEDSGHRRRGEGIWWWRGGESQLHFIKHREEEKPDRPVEWKSRIAQNALAPYRQSHPGTASERQDMPRQPVAELVRPEGEEAKGTRRRRDGETGVTGRTGIANAHNVSHITQTSSSWQIEVQRIV